MIYDSAIIGTGPAGVSAALNLKILDKNFIWLGSEKLSDKVQKAELISNYPGLPKISGKELNAAFLSQIKSMNIKITDKTVNSIVPFDDHYALMAGSDFYEIKTVILTTGVSGAGTLPGEQEFLGKGVSYCATCDGNLYRGKNIAVICNNERFEHEVEYLSKIAENLYYFPSYKNVTVSADNIKTFATNVVKIIGEDRVCAVMLKNGEKLPVDGVFCIRDSVSLNNLLPNIATDGKRIIVNRDMSTNLPGIYAAGDCTGRPYQYTKAVGEGNVAAHSVIEYLSKIQKSKNESIKNEKQPQI